MRLNFYIRFTKFFLFLTFCSTILISCICKPVASVDVNNRNAQIYVLNFSDSDVSLTIGNESFNVTPNSDSSRSYKDFCDYYSAKCIECGETHLINGYFFTYSYNKDFLYTLNNSDKFFTTESNLKTKIEIVLKEDTETLFQSELLQDIETNFNCSYEVVHESFSLQDGAYLENGNFLFTTEQKSSPSVKIIVQWTTQTNYVYTSPIYVIIVPPENS